ncbi:hypothetical protein AURDEDRAFT_116687 [Auricularia subglabra TFB-10046 SS5]|uniref:Uncharacterized protein n=1 Tax=Auricularia subglabra (strain TFB-10046 / SS5) TaxID=717982 RepID=J0LHQ9_AURST|nr:hypothetical protein AURDEDRAFT_116687 [Auricularia subglabra TFB-10046 SS5]
MPFSPYVLGTNWVCATGTSFSRPLSRDRIIAHHAVIASLKYSAMCDNTASEAVPRVPATSPGNNTASLLLFAHSSNIALSRLVPPVSLWDCRKAGNGRE